MLRSRHGSPGSRVPARSSRHFTSVRPGDSIREPGAHMRPAARACCYALPMTDPHNITIGAHAIPVTIVRSDRRTLALTVSATGEVRARAPRRLAHRHIERFVYERAGWIERKHAEAIERAAHSAGPLTAAELAEARTRFRERFDACWPLFARTGERKPQLRIRTMRSRWGSLAPSGTVTLNAHLVRLPESCLDYVILHELCHLRLRRHDAAFYAEVARYVPEWRARRAELRRHPL